MLDQPSEFPIPADAKPHQVAIILVYPHLRNVQDIAHFLHYEDPRPVRRVVAWYKAYLTGLIRPAPQAGSPTNVDTVRQPLRCTDAETTCAG